MRLIWTLLSIPLPGWYHTWTFHFWTVGAADFCLRWYSFAGLIGMKASKTLGRSSQWRWILPFSMKIWNLGSEPLCYANQSTTPLITIYSLPWFGFQSDQFPPKFDSNHRGSLSAEAISKDCHFWTRSFRWIVGRSWIASGGCLILRRISVLILPHLHNLRVLVIRIRDFGQLRPYWWWHPSVLGCPKCSIIGLHPEQIWRFSIW